MTFHATEQQLQTTAGTASVSRSNKPNPLSDMVRTSLDAYFEHLDGTAPNELYKLVISQVEEPLLESVMRHTGGNQTKAADLLGISRATLRKKLALYDFD